MVKKKQKDETMDGSIYIPEQRMLIPIKAIKTISVDLYQDDGKLAKTLVVKIQFLQGDDVLVQWDINPKYCSSAIQNWELREAIFERISTTLNLGVGLTLDPEAFTTEMDKVYYNAIGYSIYMTAGARGIPMTTDDGIVYLRNRSNLSKVIKLVGLSTIGKSYNVAKFFIKDYSIQGYEVLECKTSEEIERFLKQEGCSIETVNVKK